MREGMWSSMPVLRESIHGSGMISEVVDTARVGVGEVRGGDEDGIARPGGPGRTAENDLVGGVLDRMFAALEEEEEEEEEEE